MGRSRQEGPLFTITVLELVKECRKEFFVQLVKCRTNKLARSLSVLAKINTLTDSHPEAVSGHKLTGQREPSIPQPAL